MSFSIIKNQTRYGEGIGVRSLSTSEQMPVNMRLMARQNNFSLLIPLRDEANLMSVSITFQYISDE